MGLRTIRYDGIEVLRAVAYVVRAVTPGTYARPGAQIEDMYAPSYHARGEAGTLEVKPARKP